MASAPVVLPLQLTTIKQGDVFQNIPLPIPMQALRLALFKLVSFRPVEGAESLHNAECLGKSACRSLSDCGCVRVHLPASQCAARLCGIRDI